MKNLKFVFLVMFCQLLLFSGKAQLPAINVTTNTNPSNGYIFLADFWLGSGGTYYLLILDKEGRIVYAKSFPSSMNGSLLDFKPQPNNKYSFYNGKERKYFILDKYFDIIDTVEAKNGYTTNFHELVMTSDNHYFIIADETRTIDMSKLVSGGDPSADVLGNVIQEIDSNDSLLFEWKTLDHIPLTDCLGDLTAGAFEQTHTNGLFIDTDSSILISNPELNEITRVNLNNSDIIWRLGLKSKGNQFTFYNDSLGFIFQHNPVRFDNGNILLFDNGIGRYSRAVEYEIDEDNKTAKLVFQYRNSPDINATAMGSVTRLPNGNTFIGWGSVATMTEVDSSGSKVFEASFPFGAYRILKYDIPNPINPLLTGPSNICKGQITTFSTKACSGCSYTWSVTLGTIISGKGTNKITVKWPSEGEGTVKLIRQNTLGFKDYLTKYITVYPSFRVNMGVAKVCQGAKFKDFTAKAASWHWDFGDADTSNLSKVTHIYSSPGKYIAKLKVVSSDGCVDSSMRSVKIPGKPIADFSMDSIICTNENITVINLSTNTDTCLWDFGNSTSSNLTNPGTFSYAKAGVYKVRLIASAPGCVDSMTKTVQVNPGPKADFNFSQICNGARFINSTVHSIKHIWYFDDGDTSVINDVDHLYDSSGIYQVSLKVFNTLGCSDSITKLVSIPSEPIAAFNMDTQVCSSNSITVINNSTNADNYAWYVEDSLISGSVNPQTFSISEAGFYPVKLVVRGNSCIDSFTKTIKVHPNPNAHFRFNEICNGARFIDSTPNAVSRIWNFGDGATSILTDVDHLYSTSGIYPVQLKVINSFGCADSILDSVLIHKSPKADFTVDFKLCVAEELSLINHSTDASKFYWNFGDERTSEMMTPEAFSYGKAGTYKIKLVASTTFCSDSLFQTVFVNANPEVLFGSSQLTDSSVQFNDSSTISAGSIVSWEWDFGDGSFSGIPNPVHVYATPDTYEVKLCVTSDEGCQDCGFKTIVIKPSGIEFPEFDNQLRIFPNPNRGVFTIQSSGKFDLIMISNALGQEIKVIHPASNTEQIDLTNQSSGIYIVKLRLKNRDQIFRILVN